MRLPIKTKTGKLNYSLLTTAFLASALFYPIVAEDSSTTIGDLSARIEDLENQLNAKGGRTDDANPGDQVSPEDLKILKEEIRSLHDGMKRLQSENSELRSEIASKQTSPKKASPAEEESYEEERPSLKRKRESGPPLRAPASVDEDEETESVLKLLEQAAPDDEEEDGPVRKKQKKALEEVRETATKHAEEKAPKLNAGNAEAQYNEAFALHNKGAYKESERAFSYFIKTYPNDPLVPKAMYWKAEACLKQGKQKEAKILFVNAYKKNPEGPKAPDCLLRLGATLAIQGKKDDACTAWRKLKTDFPHMTNEMKSELATLKQQYGCEQKLEKPKAQITKAPKPPTRTAVEG